MLAGVCFGLGMLTKWTFLFFVLGPLCYAGVMAIGWQNFRSLRVVSARQSMKNILFFMAASALTFGPYYFPILGALIRETLYFSGGALAPEPKALFSFASVAFYPIQLWQEMIGPLGFILLVFGVASLAISSNPNKTFHLIWLAVPYLIFTFVIENKQARHMMPWLPAIALTMAFGTLSIFSEKMHPYMARMG